MSLNRDSSSRVGNKVNGIMKSAGIPKKTVASKTTATWESSGLQPSALDAVQEVLDVLKGLPNTVTNADPKVDLDHLWFYVDKD